MPRNPNNPTIPYGSLITNPLHYTPSTNLFWRQGLFYIEFWQPGYELEVIPVASSNMTNGLTQNDYTNDTFSLNPSQEVRVIKKKNRSYIQKLTVDYNTFSNIQHLKDWNNLIDSLSKQAIKNVRNTAEPSQFEGYYFETYMTTEPRMNESSATFEIRLIIEVKKDIF